jgi:Fe-S-cluster containining protein
MSAPIATVEIQAKIGSCNLKMSVSCPTEPSRVDDFLPLLQILSDKVVAAAEADADRQGKCISCQKGCGACCRQLVPLSPSDARNIARLVAGLPADRQAEIRRRFAAARLTLEQSGMWKKLEQRRHWPEAEVSALGIEYFRLGIPCPFLEDESCSIHLDRPITCREYLVTSPAINCASPAADSIDCLPMPAKVWLSAARAETTEGTGPYLNWIPLIQALDWVASQTEEPASKPGLELLKQLIEGLANTSTETLLPVAPGAPPLPNEPLT